MGRFKRFLKSIWWDIRIDPQQLILCLFTGCIMGAIIMLPVTGLAYFLKWVMGRPTWDGAFESSVAIWMLIFGIVYFIDYLKRKWNEQDM